MAGSPPLPPRRLTPADCHRLHAPVAGTVAKVARLGRRYMTSEWAAVHSSLDVMLENERWVQCTVYI